jgi:hypothetical protein
VGKIVNYSGFVGAIFSVIIAIMIVAICIRIKCRGKKAIIFQMKTFKQLNTDEQVEEGEQETGTRVTYLPHRLVQSGGGGGYNCSTYIIIIFYSWGRPLSSPD